MKRGRKLKDGLARRVDVWHRIIASGTRGANTKLVRRDKGYSAYHKPGSKSGRKGYGKTRKVTR